jgi:hypothetical protein
MPLPENNSPSEYPHYALIFIDENGILHQKFSPSIADDARSVLSDQVTRDFLTAVARHTRPELDNSYGALPLPKRRRIDQRETPDLSKQMMHSMMPVDNRGFRSYYEKAFENFQQTNCRVLAKAYIKLIEPRKQVNYPYNGRVSIGGTTKQLDPKTTKPPWWHSGVTHHEPDHLLKAGMEGISLVTEHE